MIFLNNNFKLEIKEIYLALLFVFSFFTNYRFNTIPIGISELMFFPLFFYTLYIFFLKQKTIIHFSSNTLLLFFTLLISIFFMLLSMNISLLNDYVKHYNMLHNFSSFLYLGLLFFSILIIKPNFKYFIKYLVFISFFIAFIFFAYSFVSNEFLGRPLFYANTEFPSLFTKNHHQIGFFSSIMILLSLHLLFHDRYFYFYVLPVIFFFVLLYSSHSYGNIFCFFIGLFFTTIIFLAPKKLIILFNKKIILLILLLFSLLIYTLSKNISFNIFFYDYFIFPGSASLRIGFVSNFFENLNLYSFLFGSGPGGYVVHPTRVGALREIHNSFLDLMLYSGIFSLLFFIFLHIKVFLKVLTSNLFFLTSLVFFLFIYSFAHTILRQPIFWMIFLYILTENFNNKKTNAN